MNYFRLSSDGAYWVFSFAFIVEEFYRKSKKKIIIYQPCLIQTVLDNELIDYLAAMLSFEDIHVKIYCMDINFFNTNGDDHYV